MAKITIVGKKIDTGFFLRMPENRAKRENIVKIALKINKNRIKIGKILNPIKHGE